MDNKLIPIEEQARSVEQTVSSQPSDKAALDAAIKSAELYFQALRLADNPHDKVRLDAKVNGLLAQAEHLKNGQDAKTPNARPTYRDNPKVPVSTRKLTTRENIILLEGAKLNGFIFKPWPGPPSQTEFAPRDGEPLFTDSAPLSLSAAQRESFDGWKRPHQALRSVLGDGDTQNNPGDGAVMHLSVPMDLVQDMTSDCSVVASLCALTSRFERGFPKLMRHVLHPYDHASDRMILSPTGKYILKLNFNGCWRRVDIDDLLPSSKTARVLHVMDRRHPRLLWPALVEKAYLKIRGGYDFPGSNSGTDLAVLTGWIPQQVFLHDAEVEPDRLWEEVVRAFHQGNVLVTIGTGKVPRREQSQLGLAAEHDYAILDISADGDTKEMLVKNPWADGDVWTGAARRRPNLGGDQDTRETEEANVMMPGTFWMDFNSILQYFENMYLNWSPGLFSHRQDLHFSWTHGPSTTAGNLFVENPQFAVTISDSGEIWLLLHRHFRTGDFTESAVGQTGYISLYLYSRDGKRVLSSEGAKVRCPFVDSPHTLLRIKAVARTTYTAVVVSQGVPDGKFNFTVSALAESSVTLTEAQSEYSQKHSLSSAWTRWNAGGNSDSPNYFSNPQFQFTLQARQKIALVLRVTSSRLVGEKMPASRADDDICVKIVIVFSNGSRITRIRLRDILAYSADYRRGGAVVEAELDPGPYTALCSTLEPGQLADFSLELHYTFANTQPLTQLLAEHAGRFSIHPAPALFNDGTNRLLAPLSVPQISRITMIARQESTNFRVVDKAYSSLFRMTIEQGQGPYKSTIASTEEDGVAFRRLSSGLRIDDLDVRPDMCGSASGGLWLVLERIAPQESGGNGQRGSPPGRRDEIIKIDMYAEDKAELGAWGSGDG